MKSAGLIAFLRDMQEKRLHMHALMVLRHGKPIAQARFAPWDEAQPHMLYSLSKSFTSTAVGFAVQEGLLRTDDRLVSFFPEYFPAPPCENMQKITVKHLLTMNTGHEVEPMLMGPDWEGNFLHSYVPHEPGTHFLYNTAATYMLSAILQKVTGRKLIDYLREKLLAPLHMSGDIWFEESPSGVAAGGFGLNVRVEDIAKLGQFYLQKGMWEGRQLLDPKWIEAAQTPWSDNSANDPSTPDWRAGYGYQFWMCRPEKVFRGDGAFGQYCVILPEQDMVVAINSGVRDMQAVLTSLWENVLPCVGDAEAPGADADALSQALRAPVTRADWEENGEAAEPPVPDPAWYGEYDVSENEGKLERIGVSAQGLVFTVNGKPARIPLDRDQWQACTVEGALDTFPSRHAGLYRDTAVRAARQGDSLRMHFCHTATPFEDVMTLRFTAHGLTLEGHRNAGFADAGYKLVGVRE